MKVQVKVSLMEIDVKGQILCIICVFVYSSCWLNKKIKDDSNFLVWGIGQMLIPLI